MIDYSELLSLAKASIEHGLLHSAPLFLNPRLQRDELRAPGETFVSLKLDGRNRGCMGNALAPVPLFESVLSNAYRSAFADERFPPVNELTLKRSTLELYHLLSEKRETYTVNDLGGFGTFVKPEHTLTLEHLGRRATMLMTVQRDHPTTLGFIMATRQKLAIPASVPWSSLICTLTPTVKTDVVKYSEVPCPVID